MKSLRHIKLRKLIMATLATAVFLPSGGIIHAEESVTPDAASGNTVTVDDFGYTINDTDVETEDDYGIVYGGGNEENSEDSTGNTVNINGGNINGVFGGMSSSGNSTGNTVNINGGDISGGVAGGVTFFPYDSTTPAGNVSDNRVVVNDGTMDFVSGGEVAFSYPTDGSEPNFSSSIFQSGGNVFGNSVTVNDGVITGGISGGSAVTGSVFNNTIDINGGTISGDIIAGEVRYPIDSSRVYDNTINISGSPNLSGARLFGGMLGSSYSPDGNTLNINTAGITVEDINFDSFDNVNFNIPANVLRGEDILTINSGTGGVDLSKIGVGISGDSFLDTNDMVNLIVNGGSSYVSGSQDIVVSKGVTLLYDANITSTADGITATIGELRTSSNPTEKSNSGDFPDMQTNIPDPFSDMAADIALGGGDTPSETPSDEPSGIGVGVYAVGGYSAFLNTGGGRIKTKTGGGSHITTRTGNYDLGFARAMGNQQTGHLYIAPVIEYAHSSYDSSFPNDIHGSGNTSYTSGGIVARQSSRNGMYYEGSLRGGRVKNKFASNDFIFNDERIRMTYSLSSPVFSSHVRIGNVNRMNKDNILDVYGIYSYARQNGSSTDLSSGDHVDFSSVNSSTIRVGYRMTTKASRISKIYTGLAYQYDTSSSSTVTSQRYPKTSPGAKGSSGILELGWKIKPMRDNPWELDIKAVGWAGFHQGFNVLANVQKSF